jgi:hypothetical protein
MRPPACPPAVPGRWRQASGERWLAAETSPAKAWQLAARLAAELRHQEQVGNWAVEVRHNSRSRIWHLFAVADPVPEVASVRDLPATLPRAPPSWPQSRHWELGALGRPKEGDA